MTEADALEIEQRADRIIGVHGHRLFYAEVLPRLPHLARPLLFQNAAIAHRLAGNAMWPLTRRAMMRMYDIMPGAAAESRAKLEGELDWLDGTLSDGRTYLAADRFTRADLTVASLLAPCVRPLQMPVRRGTPQNPKRGVATATPFYS